MTPEIDAETEEPARRLAAAEGRPVAAVVRDAARAHATAAGIAARRTPEQVRAAFARAQAELDALARLPAQPQAPDRRSVEEIVAGIEQIANRLAGTPCHDGRTDDEIIGYDERGLPA